MRKLLIFIAIAFGALMAACSKQGDTQEYDSTGSSTTKTSSSSQYSAPPPATTAPAARGESAPPSDTPKPADTSNHY